MSVQSSAKLVEKMQDPEDQTAWREFFRSYAPLVLALGRKAGLREADADSVVQETMLGAIGAIRARRFDPSKGSFKAFLRGVAYHKIRDRQAHLYRHPEQGQGGTELQEALQALPDDRPDPCADFETEWQKTALGICLDAVRGEVAPTTYQAFDLYVLKEWPAARVANFLGTTRNVVYIAKARVLSRVRSLYVGMEA